VYLTHDESDVEGAVALAEGLRLAGSFQLCRHLKAGTRREERSTGEAFAIAT